MKKIMLIVLVLEMLLVCGHAFAGDCRPIEYAELKDTSTKELINTYCKYVNYASINQSTIIKFIQLKGEAERLKMTADYSGLRTDSEQINSIQKDIDVSKASQSECLEQASKISGVLKNRKIPGPKCK